MHRIDGAGATADNKFTEGDAATGVAATVVTDDWLNSVQEEIAAVIEDSGATLDKANSAQLLAAITAKITAAIPADPAINQFGYIAGLALSNNAAAPATDIDIAAGAARSSGNTASLLLSAGLTKRLQSAGAWAAGSGGSGLFTGARAASTWYHVFLIKSDADGSIDAGFDTSVSAANRPAGYTAYRRIGSIKTDASANIIGFINVGREFIWKTPVKDMEAAVSTASTTVALSVPTGVRALASIYANIGANGGTIYVRATDAADIAVGNLAPSGFTGGIGVDANSTTEYGAAFQTALTNTSAQVAVRADRSLSAAIVTAGWREL